MSSSRLRRYENHTCNCFCDRTSFELSKFCRIYLIHLEDRGIRDDGTGSTRGDIPRIKVHKQRTWWRVGPTALPSRPVSEITKRPRFGQDLQQLSQENILKGFKAFKIMTKESERMKAEYFGGKEPF